MEQGSDCPGGGPPGGGDQQLHGGGLQRRRRPARPNHARAPEQNTGNEPTIKLYPDPLHDPGPDPAPFPDPGNKHTLTFTLFMNRFSVTFRVVILFLCFADNIQTCWLVIE